MSYPPPTGRPPGTAPSAAPGLLLVLTGPSGVGKGAVHGELRRRRDDAVLSVSATTRAPRPGEIDGVHYRFVDRPTFEQMIAEGQLLEWAEYAGNLYGTPRRDAEQAVREGHILVLDIEVQGALQVRQATDAALLVFLLPPDRDELERRLRQRGTEDEAAIARRLAVAERELAAVDHFDVAIVNDELRAAVDQLEAAIADARARTRGGRAG